MAAKGGVYNMPPKEGEYIIMKKRTTAKQLSSAITNNLLKLQKAQCYYKTSRKTEIIDVDTFRESLDFLCETIFASCVSWRFEKDINTNSYIAECGRTEGNAENIITVYLSVADGVNTEDIEKALRVEESEE